MRTFYTILFYFFIQISLIGQPELVIDFNQGPEDSFSEWYYSGTALDDNNILLPIQSLDQGIELALITNGNLSILKDINPGIEDSQPGSFFKYKDEQYFIAQDEVNAWAIWKTDGTEAGTVMFFDPGDDLYSRPKSFINAKNGWLYYSYSDKIFRTDGLINEEIYSGASFGFVSSDASRTYCEYKDAFAFLYKNDDDSFSLFQVIDDQVIELTRTVETDFFTDGYGLSLVRDGLMFNIGDSDNDGIYVYNESDQSVSHLSINGEYIPSRRTIDVNEEKNICWIAREGYFIFNGVEDEEELLFYSENYAATQGDTLIYGQYEDKVTFIPIDGISSADDVLIHTDGTPGGTSTILQLEPYTSGMIIVNKYAFFADGISNGFDPNIYQVNLETGDVLTVHNFTESSNNINSIRPIAVQDNYLYYLSNLDNDVGRELYRIKVPQMVNVQETLAEQLNYKIVQQKDQFNIRMESSENIAVSIFNTAGQLMFQTQVKSNEDFSVNLSTGYYYLNLEIDQQFKSELINIVR